MKRDAWWMDRVPGRMKQAFQRIEAHMTASQIMVTGFALAIFAGGILLSMPFCNADGHWLRFIDALFTACSAVCVTGLVTIVPATQFTLTGKVIVTADGKVATGTMPNNGAVSKALDAGTPSYTIPKGYHSGAGKVSVAVETKTVTPTKAAQDIVPSTGKVLTKVSVAAIPDAFADTSGADALAANILDGKTAFVNGVKVTGSMPDNGSATATMDGLTTTSVTIPAGYTAGGTVSLTADIEEALAAI